MYEQLPLPELVDRLRRAGHVWFRKDDLMLLEEMIRRLQWAEERERRRGNS